jgi:hypothetical protein
LFFVSEITYEVLFGFFPFLIKVGAFAFIINKFIVFYFFFLNGCLSLTPSLIFILFFKFFYHFTHWWLHFFYINSNNVILFS